MKIISDDRGCEISIKKNDPNDPFSPYTVNAKLSSGCNVFYGQNDGVHFPRFDLFLEALDKFLTERGAEITLEMTEGCRLIFYRCNQKGDVGLKMRFCKYSYSHNPMKIFEFVIEGEMKLNAEFLNEMLNDFRSL